MVPACVALHAELTRQGKRGPSGKKAMQDLQAYLRGGGVVMVSKASMQVVLCCLRVFHWVFH